jgi:hypothetical protein
MAKVRRRPTGSLLPLPAVPWFSTTAERLRSLPLDSRSAYVLSLVDGHSSVEIILQACEMDRDETLSILRKLLAIDAIRLQGA